jgi:hypothetical protein
LEAATARAAKNTTTKTRRARITKGRLFFARRSRKYGGHKLIGIPGQAAGIHFCVTGIQ